MNLHIPGPFTAMPPNARLRADVIVRFLKDRALDGGAFLEVGCGQGALATVLAPHFEYVGYEPDRLSYATALDRLTRMGRGEVLNRQLPLQADRDFDVLGAFEVLEHLEEDRAAMREWVRWLRPNGYAIVSVPAHPHRFGPWDVKVGHLRRYTRQAIEAVLIDAGLVDVNSVAYGFPLGYLLEGIRNLVGSKEDIKPDGTETAERTAASGRSLQPSSAIAPLIWLGTLPFTWIQRPFASTALGTGFVAFGRRPG